MKTVVLTGMMGSGKTSAGKILAKISDCEFTDLDCCIEQQEKQSIPDIFENRGEEYFRKIEKESLKKIFKPGKHVISLGGGTFENPDTRDFLLKNSNVFYLQTSPEIIFERIKNSTSRPLLSKCMTIKKITEILEKRECNYKKAQNIIVTDNLTPLQTAELILGVLKK